MDDRKMKTIFLSLIFLSIFPRGRTDFNPNSEVQMKGEGSEPGETASDRGSPEQEDATSSWVLATADALRLWRAAVRRVLRPAPRLSTPEFGFDDLHP